MTTTHAEAAYFDGHHCQHVADWLDHQRRQRALQRTGPSRRTVRR